MNPLHALDNWDGKQLIGYGANLAALLTMKTCGVEFSFVVDDNRELQGQTLANIPIRPVSALSDVDWNLSRLVVCAYNPRSILSMQSKLEMLALQYPEHWIDCSLLHFNTMGKKLGKLFGISPDPLLFFRIRALTLFSSIENMSSISGTWLFIELLNHLAIYSTGGVAEMGVYRGGNAFTALSLGPRLAGWKYHLFDSFKGLPEFSSFDPTSRRGEFTETSVKYIKSIFANFPNVHVHPGLFHDTLPSIADERFNLVYVDCDLYEPTLECCEFFYERLNRGGIMLFHDYYEKCHGLPLGVKAPFTGVKLAVDEFSRSRAIPVVPFTESTHALIVK